MYKLLLVTTNKGSFSDFASALLTHDSVDLIWAESGSTALDMISDIPVDLVVADETLGDMSGLRLASEILSINFMVNCAVVSPLSHEDFHEMSEGLGLIAQLPSQLGVEQADDLLRRLKKIEKISFEVKSEPV